MIGWNANASIMARYDSRIISALLPDFTWYHQNHGFLLSANLSYRNYRTKDRMYDYYMDETIPFSRTIHSTKRGDAHSLNGRITGEYTWKRSSFGLTAGMHSAKNFDSVFYDATESSDDNSLKREISNSRTASPWSKKLSAGARYIYRFDEQGTARLTAMAMYQTDMPNKTNYLLNVQSLDDDIPASTHEIDQSYEYKYHSLAFNVSFKKRFADGSTLDISGIGANNTMNEQYTDRQAGYDFGYKLSGENLSASYTRQWCAVFSSRIGVRQEYFVREINLKDVGEEYDDKFLLFLPNVSLTFLLGGARHSVNLDWYTQTIHPLPSQLNPYRTWISATEYSEGNPHIPITMRHQVALQYGFLGQYFLSANYSTGKSSNEEYVFVDEAGNTGSTFLLNKRHHDFNLDLSFNKNFFDYRWRIGAYASMRWRNSKAALAMNNIHNHSINFYGGVNTMVVISRKYDLTASASYMWSGADKDLIRKVSSTHSLSLGVGKSLWKNADIQASVTIPLSKTTTTLVSGGITKVSRSYYSDEISARVTFNWNFGKMSIERLRDLSL